ncbi:RDD family protein [Flagellimonas myxillae]|uniref:RDD family protein n=1 Tax=Flagellimonas myxillae TaxID=2942214 RepID=UPI00201F7C74|nr:RDD family protein [Muricauda myxillae]MCL6268025.1 RDD family protein [Muricauda myxillae]
MNRQQQLTFCKICTHRKNDFERGIVCGLTNELADFEFECPSYEKDPNLSARSFGSMHSQGTHLHTASGTKRFINYLIDYLFIIGLGALVGGVLGLVLNHFAPDKLYLLLDDNKMKDYALGAILLFVYYVFFEGFTGRTIGKFFTKTKVVMENGDKPTFTDIVIRSLCRMIPFEAFSFLGKDAIGWHDTLSKTRVVEMED